MKFANFIFRNTLRNKRRTVLTILSISMSLFLISTLRTLLDTLENPPLTPESAKRVVIRHATGLANTMPIKYRDEISRVPGVDSVSSSQWFGGIYKDPANFFAQFAVDADRFFDVYNDIHTQTPEQKAKFIKDRTGALAGVTLAKRFGWKVGDRITLEGAIFPVNPEMTIDGLVNGGASESNFYFHLDYLNELFRPNGGAWNQVGTFIVKAKNAEDLPAISENIDGMYESSTAPTKTESEAAFILGFVSMLGNVRLLVMSISTVVLFHRNSGCGEYHGDVHPRTNRRNRHPEDARIRTGPHPLYDGGRVHDDCAGRRASGIDWSPVSLSGSQSGFAQPRLCSAAGCTVEYRPAFCRYRAGRRDVQHAHSRLQRLAAFDFRRGSEARRMIPVRYNLRSIIVRRVGTLMTVLGVGLTVAVFVSILAMVHGLQNTFVDSGEPLNLMIIRQGSQSETNSFFDREIKGIIETKEGVQSVAGEIVVVINRVRVTGDTSNVMVRGVDRENIAWSFGRRSKLPRAECLSPVCANWS